MYAGSENGLDWTKILPDLTHVVFDDGAGAANRIPYYSAAGVLASSSYLTWDPSTQYFNLQFKFMALGPTNTYDPNLLSTIRFHSGGNATAVGQVIYSNTTNANGAFFACLKNRGASLDSRTSTQNNDVLGEYRVYGMDANASPVFKIGGALTFYQDGAAADGYIPARAEIRLSTGAVAYATKATFYNTGDVVAANGIGAAGDSAGLASTTILTNQTVAISTGTNTVKSRTGSNVNNTGFIKIMIGTTAYYVPYWA